MTETARPWTPLAKEVEVVDTKKYKKKTLTDKITNQEADCKVTTIYQNHIMRNRKNLFKEHVYKNQTNMSSHHSNNKELPPSVAYMYITTLWSMMNIL